MSDEADADLQHSNSYDRVPPQLRPHAWKPGQSGNPKGRPRGQSMTAQLRELIDEDAIAEAGSWQRAINLALVRAAAEGNVAAIKVVFEYLDGKPAQSVVVSREEPETMHPDVAAAMIKAGGDAMEALGLSDDTRSFVGKRTDRQLHPDD